MLTRDRAWPSRSVIVAAGALAVTVVVVMLIVFSPSPPDMDGQRRLAAWLAQVHRTWMPRWVTFGLVEFVSNVVMFVPLGLFAALVLPRLRWLAVVLCCLFSCCIEGVQALVLPHRYASLGDIAANTLGGLVGFVLAVGMTRMTRSSGQAPD